MPNQASPKVAPTEGPATGRRARLHEIIFEADTRAGRLFDLALIWLILLSVATVILESVRSVREQYGELLYALEWLYTLLFTFEYALRLLSVRRPLRYATKVKSTVSQASRSVSIGHCDTNDCRLR